MKVKWKCYSLSQVQLCDPMDYSPLGSSIHRILQARIREWVAIPFSRGSSWPRGRTQISLIVGRFFTTKATREAHGWDELMQISPMTAGERERPCWWLQNHENNHWALKESRQLASKENFHLAPLWWRGSIIFSQGSAQVRECCFWPQITCLPFMYW